MVGGSRFRMGRWRCPPLPWSDRFRYKGKKGFRGSFLFAAYQMMRMVGIVVLLLQGDLAFTVAVIRFGGGRELLCKCLPNKETTASANLQVLSFDVSMFLWLSLLSLFCQYFGGLGSSVLTLLVMFWSFPSVLDVILASGCEGRSFRDFWFAWNWWRLRTYLTTLIWY